METRDSVDLPSQFDDLAIGISLHDPETGTILDVNDRLEDFYGYSTAELRTMETRDFIPSSTRFSQEEALQRVRAAADGDDQVFERQIERANGEIRWVRVHLHSIIIGETPYVLAEIHGISEYKAREQRLRLLSRIIRHNLRNEMNLLMGHADQLRAAVEDESLEETAKTVLDIASDVASLSDSVTQIKKIANPNATERSPTNLHDVAQARVEEARAEHADADLTITSPPDVWAIADEGIHYAVAHAIENAIEHNDQETPSVDVTVAERTDAGYGEIRIADNGPPIPAIEKEVLDQSIETNSTYHGSGTGLWVMQWCVNSLGGKLRFNENTPRGNVVCLSLPLIESMDDNPWANDSPQ